MSFKRQHNQGFTLMELLVVLAISMILMGLVLMPVIQSFNLTRQAQAMVEAQDAARQGMELISREVGEAMYVFNNTSVPVTVVRPSDSTDVPSTLNGPIALPVRKLSGSIQWFSLPNAKIDFILPKITMHCNNPKHPSGEPRNYDRGDEAWPPCPACTKAGRDATNVEAKPSFPLEQDSTVVRYFLGLRHNDPEIDEPGEVTESNGMFGWKSPYYGEVQPDEENQVVLYRVEFDPRDDTLFPASMSPSERLNDPIFFYRKSTCKAWREKARIIGVGKYEDLVIGTYVSDEVTEVEPTITFSFTAINNDTFAGAYSQDKSFEYPDAVPVVFTAAYGYWLNNLTTITVARSDNSGNTLFTTGVDASNQHVMIYDGSTGVFDMTDYQQTGAIHGAGSTPVTMAFVVDDADSQAGRVRFDLRPPRPDGEAHACTIISKAVNDDYLAVFATDRGSARRWVRVRTLMPIWNGQNNDAYYLKNAALVPGSERIVGPNMTPGSRYGYPVLYERVPLNMGDAGLNQYKIDYDTGDLYFSSAYDQPLPEKDADGNATTIAVDYKIHFNQWDDVVKGDYTTTSLVNIHMGMRMFDADSGKPHAVDLNNSVKVRNALR